MNNSRTKATWGPFERVLGSIKFQGVSVLLLTNVQYLAVFRGPPQCLGGLRHMTSWPTLLQCSGILC